jgi:phage tail sheath protein FI
MPEYMSPGVYVEEVESSIKPISGVSTSTAAFLGVVPGPIQIPEDNPNYDPNQKQGPGNLPYRLWTYPLTQEVYNAAKTKYDALAEPGVRPPRPKGKETKDFQDFRRAQEDLAVAAARLASSDFAPEGQPILCTTFGDFTRHFGGFSTNGLLPDAAAGGAPAAPAAAGAAAPEAKPPVGQNQLAHGVFAFFNNGGTRCYVMRYAKLEDLRDPLKLTPLETIDEISLVAAPGITDPGVQNNVVNHCTNMSDRFAILEAPEAPHDLTEASIKKDVQNTDYGALYFPRIKVFDSAYQATHPDSDGEIFVGAAGHVAGIYSRVDHERGVFKAPANETIRGALDIEYQVSRNLQDGLNPGGVNCIRNINGSIKVWGARTIGGDMNSDLKYINVRRTLLYLRKSIDHGTQWVVFEPNTPTLWAKIVRNVTAFLTMEWRDGALFGTTPQEAFYVRCDAETNPPESRELGRVVTEIGVAIVRPAEFVIFRLAQWQPTQEQ